MSVIKLAIAARGLNACCDARAKRSGRARRLPALFFVTDETRMDDPCAIARRLPRGTGILFRHYGAPDRARLAHRLSKIARARGLILFVAADLHLAMAVGAQGVHWPQGLMRPSRAARPLLVTAAAHDRASLIRARRIGADAAILSPVFATRSGPNKHALGAVGFASLLRAVTLPVYALGGINEKSALRLKNSGAAGLAAVDAFLENAFSKTDKKGRL